MKHTCQSNSRIT